MSQTTKISVCTDSDTKKQAEDILSSLGLNMTSAINIYLKRIIIENGIPFPLKIDSINQTTLNALKEYEEMINHPDKYKKYSSFEEAMKDIN